MKNKYNFLTEKLLIYIPFIIFILYTNIHYLFAMKSNLSIITVLINIFNFIFMKGPYVFLLISIILIIYIIINGNKKQNLIMIATTIGCFLTYYNSLANEQGFLTALLFISTYLIGIFYSIALYICLKNKKIDDIKKKIISGAKSVVIYIGIIYFLAIVSNTSQYSYIYSEQGITAWFRSTNGLGHALVFLLPIFISFHIKDKKNSYLFYIIVISILDLLIGTKACYFSLLATLFFTTIYLFIDYMKSKKYHYFKLLSIAIILGFVLLISSSLYVTNNIEQSIKHNSNETGQFDIINFVISDREKNADIIEPIYSNGNIYSKLFGLGLYYPRFNFIYVELDLLDLLYSRGLFGLLLYMTFFGFIILSIIKKVFKNIKKYFDIDVLLMFLTLFYILFASIFVGHVIFNLMPLSIAIIVMLYYLFIINKKVKK